MTAFAQILAPLDASSSQPLYQQLQRVLRDAIEKRLLGPDDALPAERELANQVHALGNDRARLASDLDDATARARVLETVNREIAQRIDQAIETIRGALEFSD